MMEPDGEAILSFGGISAHSFSIDLVIQSLEGTSQFRLSSSILVGQHNTVKSSPGEFVRGLGRGSHDKFQVLILSQEPHVHVNSVSTLRNTNTNVFFVEVFKPSPVVTKVETVVFWHRNGNTVGNDHKNFSSSLSESVGGVSHSVSSQRFSSIF